MPRFAGVTDEPEIDHVEGNVGIIRFQAYDHYRFLQETT